MDSAAIWAPFALFAALAAKVLVFWYASREAHGHEPEEPRPGEYVPDSEWG